jgi:hypothetical protein
VDWTVEITGSGGSKPDSSVLAVIRRALEDAGHEVTGWVTRAHPGQVRLPGEPARQRPPVLDGAEISPGTGGYDPAAEHDRVQAEHPGTSQLHHTRPARFADMRAPARYRRARAQRSDAPAAKPMRHAPPAGGDGTRALTDTDPDVTVAELAEALTQTALAGRDPTDLAADLWRKIRAGRTARAAAAGPVTRARLTVTISARHVSGPELPAADVTAAARHLLTGDRDRLQIAPSGHVTRAVPGYNPAPGWPVYAYTCGSPVHAP